MKVKILHFVLLILVSCQVTPKVNVNNTKEVATNSGFAAIDSQAAANARVAYEAQVDYSDTTIYQKATKSLIPFYNPSFELNPSNHSSAPKDWMYCDDRYNSPPDIHSNTSSFFEVRKQASDGEKYIGMVVRADGSCEHLAQKLGLALEVGSTYQFTIDLAHSKQFISLSKAKMQEVKFNEWTILQVWGAEEICSESFLLHKTPVIDHLDWKNYTIEFTASQAYKYIILEAFYTSDKKYNGNLVLDNLSPIRKVE